MIKFCTDAYLDLPNWSKKPNLEKAKFGSKNFRVAIFGWKKPNFKFCAKFSMFGFYKKPFGFLSNSFNFFSQKSLRIMEKMEVSFFFWNDLPSHDQVSYFFSNGGSIWDAHLHKLYFLIHYNMLSYISWQTISNSNGTGLTLDHSFVIILQFYCWFGDPGPCYVSKYTIVVCTDVDCCLLLKRHSKIIKFL